MCITGHIAKLNIQFDLKSSELNKRLEKYQTNEKYVYTIRTVVVEELLFKGTKIYSSKYYDLYNDNGVIIQYQRDLRNSKYVGAIFYSKTEAILYVLSSDIYEAEYLMSEYATFYYILNNRDAVLIHSSSICYKDKAYLFSAKSGTGKSTHTGLWIKLGLAEYINDDKNIIVYENGTFFVCGNPWSGKHGLDNNLCVELKGIIYLKRAEKCEIHKLNKLENYKNLLAHTLLPNPLLDNKKWEKLISILLNTNAYSLGANISNEAVQVVKKELDGELDEDKK